jgi:hypothetical protein
VATAPLGHSSRRRLGFHCGRSPKGAVARRPDGPSIITSRTSASVSPTSAMRPTGRAEIPEIPPTRPVTHSALARVLPAPRPPRTSQVCQEPASSGGI